MKSILVTRSVYGSVLVALVATLMIGAVASASAALPEFTPANAQFTGTTGSTKVYGTGGSFSCGYATDPSGIEVGKALYDFAFNGWNCGAFCPSLEPYKSSLLKGQVGYLSAKNKEVGFLLEPQKGSTWWYCPLGGYGSVTGSIVGTITPVNQKTTKFTVTFKDAKKLEGEPTNHTLFLRYANGEERWFELATTVYLTTPGAIELKA